MSSAAGDDRDTPHGTSLLPQDLSAKQKAGAPTLVSADALLIEDLTDLEDQAFAAALHS